MPRRAVTRRTSTTLAAGLTAVGLAVSGIAGAGAASAAPATAPGDIASAAAAGDYASLVNPFVGTEDEGNAYPGATLPFGMVQLSPDNTNTYGSTSYSNEAGQVWGFSHRHVNSAGCPAAGEVLVTPSTASDPITDRQFIPITPGTESAEAGYYTATLDSGVTAELTATERTGVHRYTFPATTTANLSFNVGQTLRDAGASSIAWVDDHTLEGWVDNGGFCGGTDRKERVFFSATFDRPAAVQETWQGGTVQPALSSEVASGSNGAVAVFDTTADQTVEVEVGVSFVDVDGARANRVAELGAEGTPFDDVRAFAHEAWNEQLSVAQVEASADAQRIFYTQLYKSLLSPTIGSDVDGRYRGQDGQIHTADGWTYHQTFSLWDTYRTQAALHALLVPDTAEDIVRSMLQQRVEGGWLPRWSLGSIETNIMAGDPVSAWLAENFAYGTVPADISDELWGYLVENATTAPPEGGLGNGRLSAEYYLANGHIPYYSENDPGLGQQYEEYRHGGSATMEFSVSDAAIGAAATRLGKPEAAEFLQRGRNWQNLWNPAVELSGGFTGIVNAVRPDGSFVPVDENAQVQESGFHEGTQWQYQWMAGQDFSGLQEKMGGTEGFLDRLDYYFDLPALQAQPGVSPEHWAAGGSDYYSSIGYNPGNEPTIMNPWLYSSAGEPWKVNDVLAANLNRFPDTPGGGVGNDDLGTMSSWYVFATLGFEPIVPGSGILAFNAPRVQAATVRVGDSTLTISAPGATESTPSYIRSLSVDGVDHTATWADVDQLADGGSLVFGLTSDAAAAPTLTWGTAVADRLPSVADPASGWVPGVSPGADPGDGGADPGTPGTPGGGAGAAPAAPADGTAGGQLAATGAEPVLPLQLAALALLLGGAAVVARVLLRRRPARR
ncbi:GH92 family glycosyl hydrolase [Cnuibacter physcomitrellae]|uniref:GH92 family glycosyl hydrolase n=1 Tax=Cnuibacter physcomitrellae TaxID=1619308 RepID=UPI00166EE45E|nr:GH92 family glycosyl hydrolase [Cnuibacter physcomitrellae]